MDCAPYTCLGTSCKTACVSVLDCVFPAECGPDGKCLSNATGASTPGGSSGGCGCVVGTATGDGRTAGLAVLGVLMGFAAQRRRSRSRAG
jgi:MYXO-CTERM domain-containing protein